MGGVAVTAEQGVVTGLAVAPSLALAVGFGQQDLAHAHGEEAEGRGVLAVFCPAVVAAVWVTPADREPPLDEEGTYYNMFLSYLLQ